MEILNIGLHFMSILGKIETGVLAEIIEIIPMKFITFQKIVYTGSLAGPRTHWQPD
jgi:hypothetical protein